MISMSQKIFYRVITNGFFAKTNFKYWNKPKKKYKDIKDNVSHVALQIWTEYVCYDSLID